MLVAIAGPEWSANVDHVVERPDDEAKTLIEGGYAAEVVETAEAPVGAETAVKPEGAAETAAGPKVQVAKPKV